MASEDYRVISTVAEALYKFIVVELLRFSKTLTFRRYPGFHLVRSTGVKRQETCR